jgi:trigger factor
MAADPTISSEILEIPRISLDEKSKVIAQEHTKKMRAPRGFRQGHVPLQYVLKVAGDQIREMALSELNQVAFKALCKEQKIKPIKIIDPTFEEQAAESTKDAVLVKVIYEALPKGFELLPHKIKVKAEKAKISPKDIDAAVERMRDHHATWEDVDRPVKVGDQLELLYEKLEEKEEHPQTLVVIGENKLPKAFDRYLKKRSCGDTITIPVKFPKDFSVASLQGKSNEFTVTIRSVKEKVLPELDADFAKKLHIEGGTADAIRQAIADLLEREGERLSEQSLKKKLMDALIDAHKKMPCSNALFQNHLAYLVQGEKNEAEKERILSLTPKSRDDKAKEASRGARLNVLVSELIEHYGIEVTEQALREYIEKLAGDYQDKEAFVRWFQQDKRSMNQAYSALLEEKLIEALKKDATIDETRVAFSKLKDAS